MEVFENNPDKFFEWKFVKIGGRNRNPVYRLVATPVPLDEAKKRLDEAYEQEYADWELCHFRFTPGLRCKKKECTFAHQVSALAPMIQDRSWKLKAIPCKHYHTLGPDGQPVRECRYGPRCNYVHDVSAEEMLGGLFTQEEILDRFDHVFQKRKQSEDRSTSPRPTRRLSDTAPPPRTSSDIDANGPSPPPNWSFPDRVSSWDCDYQSDFATGGAFACLADLSHSPTDFGNDSAQGCFTPPMPISPLQMSFLEALVGEKDSSELVF